MIVEGFELIKNSAVFQLMSEYAYNPWMVYSIVVGLLVASSLGLPLPEEITILSAGFLAHISANPDLYPPPEPGMQGVNPWTMAAVGFVAVVGSDFIIYSLGRFFGRRLAQKSFIKRILPDERLSKVEGWAQKHGYLAVVLFRFTPGLRFPGHLACGFLRFSAWKFLLIDGTAALLTVPTQILLVAWYGDHIINQLYQNRLLLVLVGVFVVLLVVGWKWYHSRRRSLH